MKLIDKIVELKIAIDKLPKLSKKVIDKLERKWDIESAYQSAKMEGSNLTKKEFYKIAENII